MRSLFSTVLAIALCCAAGCASDPPSRIEPVDFKGVAKLSNGKVITDANLLLQPTSSDALPATLKLGPKGEFNGNSVPHKYIYFFESEKKSALAGIPPSFLKPDAANTVEIPSAGGEVNVTVPK